MSGRPDNTRPKPRPSGGSATMAHVDPDRDEVNFFPTPPWAARAGAELVKQLDPRARSAWEPACGGGHMVHGLADFFPIVHASDKYLYDRNALWDFVGGDSSDEGWPEPPWRPDWVITNPPFDLTAEFIQRAHQVARRGVAMLMRGGLLEGQERHQLLTQTCPLTYFAPFSERVPMFKQRWDPAKSTAAFYAWFIWLKTRRGPPRPPQILWIAPGAKARLSRPSDLAFAAVEAE
jgi:hypothetical protein